jgi:hypothetical protein
MDMAGSSKTISKTASRSALRREVSGRAEFTDLVRTLKALFDPYRPELHYMRGPDPSGTPSTTRRPPPSILCRSCPGPPRPETGLAILTPNPLRRVLAIGVHQVQTRRPKSKLGQR